MYTIRAIWEGELLVEDHAFRIDIAYNSFGNMQELFANDQGVSIQLIDTQNNVISDFYIV